MFLRVEDRERMVAKGEDGGVGRRVGCFPSENDPAMSEM